MCADHIIAIHALDRLLCKANMKFLTLKRSNIPSTVVSNKYIFILSLHKMFCLFLTNRLLWTNCNANLAFTIFFCLNKATRLAIRPGKCAFCSLRGTILLKLLLKIKTSPSSQVLQYGYLLLLKFFFWSFASFDGLFRL